MEAISNYKMVDGIGFKLAILERRRRLILRWLWKWFSSTISSVWCWWWIFPIPKVVVQGVPNGVYRFSISSKVSPWVSGTQKKIKNMAKIRITPNNQKTPWVVRWVWNFYILIFFMSFFTWESKTSKKLLVHISKLR